MAETFDRRAIPAGAIESRWTSPDGHSIRRIDWPEPAAPARGSLLFMPGRGDAYEKYLETLDHWCRQGWRVTATDLVAFLRGTSEPMPTGVDGDLNQSDDALAEEIVFAAEGVEPITVDLSAERPRRIQEDQSARVRTRETVLPAC